MRCSCIGGVLEHSIACVQHRSVWLGLKMVAVYSPTLGLWPVLAFMWSTGQPEVNQVTGSRPGAPPRRGNQNQSVRIEDLGKPPCLFWASPMRWMPKCKWVATA